MGVGVQIGRQEYLDPYLDPMVCFELLCNCFYWRVLPPQCWRLVVVFFLTDAACKARRLTAG